jgi:hypothetical protein
LEHVKSTDQSAPPVSRPSKAKIALSARARPFLLQNVRILDFSWFLASAGGTRFAAALGAECIEVEWKENPDTRLAAIAPVGGRKARERATAPLPGVDDPDMGGQYGNKNSGKRGISLNIRKPKGLEIARRLVGVSDVVAEGFSPGVLDRLGLGYAVQRSIRPDIIYVQHRAVLPEFPVRVPRLIPDLAKRCVCAQKAALFAAETRFFRRKPCQNRWKWGRRASVFLPPNERFQGFVADFPSRATNFRAPFKAASRRLWVRPSEGRYAGSSSGGSGGFGTVGIRVSL